jgi:transposase
LEIGVCSCAELQVLLVTEAERKHARRRELSSSFFLLQGKEQKEIQAILTKKLGEHATSYKTEKNWVTQFKRGDFSACVASRSGRTKRVTTPEIIEKFTS